MCCTGLSLCRHRACVCRSVFVHNHRWRSCFSSVLWSVEFLFRRPSRHHGDDVHILGLFVDVLIRNSTVLIFSDPTVTAIYLLYVLYCRHTQLPLCCHHCICAWLYHKNYVNTILLSLYNYNGCDIFLYLMTCIVVPLCGCWQGGLGKLYYVWIFVCTGNGCSSQILWRPHHSDDNHYSKDQRCSAVVNSITAVIDCVTAVIHRCYCSNKQCYCSDQ